jgi:hypothetical protein
MMGALVFNNLHRARLYRFNNKCEDFTQLRALILRACGTAMKDAGQRRARRCPFWCRTPRFRGEGGKVWYRRNLVIVARPGEGPFTIRFADVRHRPLPTGPSAVRTSAACNRISGPAPDCHSTDKGSRQATYALASRLRASWMEGEGNEGGQGFGKVFAVLARRRQNDEALPVVAPLDDLYCAQKYVLPHEAFSPHRRRGAPRQPRATCDGGGHSSGKPAARIPGK